MKFHELLAQYRKRKGLPKMGLAKMLKLSSGYVMNLESGVRKPPPVERCEQIISILELNNEEAFEFLGAAIKAKMPKHLKVFYIWQEKYRTPKTKGEGLKWQA